MDQTHQLNKNFLIIVFVVAVAALAAGYYFGAAAEKTKAATSRAALVKEIFAPVLTIANVFGKILEISSDQKSLILEVPNMFQVNLPAEYRRKRITVVPETKIVLFEQKIFDAPAAGRSPISVVEKEITIGDLKIGDQVSVIFSPESGKTFFDSEFTAVSISVNR